MPNIIRISRGIEINVNEAGDIICIPVDDMNFIDNVMPCSKLQGN